MKTAGTFHQRLISAIGKSGLSPRALTAGECQDPARNRCRICHAAVLSYPDEVQLKTSVFRDFWGDLGQECRPDPLIPSPQGRHYRMVTKRKVFVRGRRLTLGLIDPGRPHPFTAVACAIEPPDHGAIYAHLQNAVNAPWAEPLARELQYAVIRGNEREFTVILNVRTLTGGLIRTGNTLSKSLTGACAKVAAVFLFEGGEEDRYYMGGTDPIVPKRFRKLFGDAEVFQEIGARKFLYSPFSFSQVNHSILPVFLETAERLLGPRKEQHLYDLYCGYGLFSLSFAPQYGRVTGIEMSHVSVTSAIGNAHRRKAHNVRFLRSSVNAGSIGPLTSALSQADAVLLDPPRGGTGPAVVEEIAARRPRNVLHIFCNIDILQSDLARWSSGGYRVANVVPFDMFPGTSDLEIMVLLRPDPL